MGHGSKHTHDHSGEHSHSHALRITSLNKAFTVGIILNLVFVGVEFFAGVYYGSMALLSDAGHNLSDVVGLVLAMLAFRLSKVRSNNKYTYGYKKSTVLASLFNALILLVAVGGILAESIHKLYDPQPVQGGAIAVVAGVGVLINAFTALMFVREKEQDLNVKGAYIHMAADALVSVGVLVSGLVIRATGWYVVDPIIGITVALAIFVSTWKLLRDSIRLSLDGVPANIKPETVKRGIRGVDGVADVHHIHIWALSTTENAMTAHIVVSGSRSQEELKCDLRRCLEGLGITHTTFEFEQVGEECEAKEE